jgi:heptosyltransferase-2
MKDPFVDLHTDCRHFRWDRPCAPHKRAGYTCPGCPEYDPAGARLLMVKLAAVGDVLRTTALLPAVRKAWPGARITWLTQPAARDLFAGNELVDEVLTCDDALTAARLQVEQFDAVLCPDADPQAAVLAAAARTRLRRGFSMDERGRVVPLGAGAQHWLRMGLDDRRKRANRDTYQKLIADVLEVDAAAIGRPVLVPRRDDREAARAWRATLGFGGALVGLNTGAGGRWLYKQWTLEHQRTFVREMSAAGAGVVLLGGPAERERHRELLAGAGGSTVFDAGNDNSYSRFAALVELCSALVTGDTFALHVACAREVPVIALFGPTSAAEVELYGKGEKIVPPDLDCLCCYLPVCDVEPHCQALIEPHAVIAAVQRWL